MNVTFGRHKKILTSMALFTFTFQVLVVFRSLACWRVLGGGKARGGDWDRGITCVLQTQFSLIIFVKQNRKKEVFINLQIYFRYSYNKIYVTTKVKNLDYK